MVQAAMGIERLDWVEGMCPVPFEALRPPRNGTAGIGLADFEVSQLLLNPEFLSLQILEDQAIGRGAFLFGGNLFVQIAVLCSKFTDATVERHRQSPLRLRSGLTGDARMPHTCR
ncbi:hypothetical protein BBF93_18515 [Hyphomonas sp. CACIAM 19H1]|nr:hypothetical protein BBF93_18515 [Hyphomonas sp. CACIAM 19H1]